jgi:hypothetical protein
MKTSLLILLAIGFIFIDTTDQVTPQKHYTSLTYVQSSNGLGIPALEGGRTDIKFADINDDGNVDILSIGDHGSPYVNTNEHGIMVWFGDGTGNWEVYQNGEFGYGGIAVGDVNNDGYLDVGYGMHHNYSGVDFGDQLIEVALGDGTGMNWTPWDDGLATNGETWGMFGTDFADIDCDGYLDLGSISFGYGAGIHIYRNNTDGTWEQVFGFIGGNSDMLIEFGDINIDGQPDFSVSHQFGTIYFKSATSSFLLEDTNLPSGGDMGRTGISLGDVDNDGGKDLAFINNTGGVEVWIWKDYTDHWVDWSGTLPSSGTYEATQLYDMNVDGFIDVAAFGEGTFTLWLGDGTGNWTFETEFTTPPYGYFIAFRIGGDVDHNGYPDIALVTEEGDWMDYQNHLYCFKEALTPENLTISPMFPRGRELVQPNAVQYIDWSSAVPGNVQSWVKLEFSMASNTGPWYPIADSLPNNGRFQWTIPGSWFKAVDCYIKYTVYTSTESKIAITPEPFMIDFPYGIGKPSLIQDTNLYVYPNPFHNELTLNFEINQKDDIRIEIYNPQGHLIKKLYDGICDSGQHKIVWNGLDMQGRSIGKGIYYLTIRAGNRTFSKKLIYIG